MIFRRTALILVVACMPVRPALAWNNTGHMVVALIAYRTLSPDARKTVSELLKRHPHYPEPVRFFTEERPGEVSEEEWAFLRAATWPDFVRTRHPAEVHEYHRPSWHFINLPYVRPQERGDFAGRNLKEPTPNAVTVLGKTVAVLKDPSAEDDDVIGRLSDEEIRAVRLCWLLHLIGDIHQPLHSAALVSQKFTPPEWDRGGNSLAVRVGEDDPIRLHTYWDDLLGKTEDYQALDAIADELLADDSNTADASDGVIGVSTFKAWAGGSLALAKEKAYLNGDLPIDKWDQEDPQPESADVPQLSQQYQTAAKDTAKKQVRLAGLRLARAIEKLFPKLND